MKQATFEDEFSTDARPILEDAHLDAMTDEQLQEELGNLLRQARGEDPLGSAVKISIRLIQRHLSLRDLSDQKLASDLEQAEWSVQFWTAKFNENKIPAWHSNAVRRRGNADDYRRELARREALVEQEDDEEGYDVLVLPDGIFLFPNYVPQDMPHEERSDEEMRIWWGRPFITENDGSKKSYHVQCLDGGAWDRPTFKGRSETVEGAIEIARRLLA